LNTIILVLASLGPALSGNATAPSALADAFAYAKPAHLETREAGPLKSSPLPGTHQRQIVFKNVYGHDVPVLITTPDRGQGPFRTVLLLHGFGGTKEEITAHAGAPMLKAGFACIAPDLPLHGQRPGNADDFFTSQYDQSYRYAVEAVTDTRQTIDLAAAQRDLLTTDGVALVGFSMGTWLGSLTAAVEPRVTAMVLMSGGSAVILPSATSSQPADLSAQQKVVELRNALIQAYPVLRHDSALTRFAPRPLLMQNGRRDVVATPQKVRTLFETAGEPKQLRWYDSGHSLPAQAYREAAECLREHWGTTASRPS
jgi:uncharacterized protein